MINAQRTHLKLWNLETLQHPSTIKQLFASLTLSLKKVLQILILKIWVYLKCDWMWYCSYNSVDFPWKSKQSISQCWVGLWYQSRGFGGIDPAARGVQIWAQEITCFAQKRRQIFKILSKSDTTYVGETRQIFFKR